MIKIFEKFTRWEEVESYINICKEIMVDFDLNRPGKLNRLGQRMGGIDTYGNFKELFDKYYEIKKVILEKFPDFRVKDHGISYGGKYSVNHINWADGITLKKDNFIVLLEMNHSLQENPDYGGRLRFWGGIDKDGVNINCYRKKPMINISEIDPLGEEDWGDDE